MSMVLSFKSTTWHKDSHSLFDYESNKTTTCENDVSLMEKQLVIQRKKNCNFGGYVDN
jgi:hypothetical protein